MNWDNTERERIIEQALSALTPSEIRHATQELQQWTRTYPQDFGIVDTFEVLSHKQDFAEEREQRATTQEPAIASHPIWAERSVLHQP
jgi:hypothetical protein